jgi:UDP-N-acetylglucosamine 2-epimerase (non-hydrolysing)
MANSQGYTGLIAISFGTRPEWIKIKPLVDFFHGKLEFRLIFTGQHTDLLTNLPSNLDINKINISQGSNRLDSIVESVLNQEEIWEGVTSVMVQGDTTSAFSVALAAFHRKIKVIHLEAGLRTYDKSQPYPEEFNRQAISRIADIHLCPTETSKAFLTEEKTQGRIEVVGNTVLDNIIDVESSYTNRVVVTMHRRENHKNLDEWFAQLDNLARLHKGLEFVIPLHPNPNVQKHAHVLKNFTVISALEYEDFIELMSKARFVITDSGGLQEETSFLNKKCIVCREKTERLEGLGTFAFLCPSPSDLPLLFDMVNVDYEINLKSPYGDGMSAKRVYEVIRDEV